MKITCSQCGSTLPADQYGFCPACRKQSDQKYEISLTDHNPQWEERSSQFNDPALLITEPLSPANDPPPTANKAKLAMEQLAQFQKNLAELTPRAWVTPLIIGLNVLVFILIVATGTSPTEPKITDLLQWGANFGPLTTNGEWWRLFTSTFIHIGIIHILMNMWCFYGVAPLVERMVGNLGFLALYLVSGLCGSVASLLWNPLVVGAGASGAIFGIYGALPGLILGKQNTIPKEAFAHLRSSIIGFLILNLIYGISASNIDLAAHIGGLVTGFLGGIILSKPFTTQSLAFRPLRNVLLAIAGSLLIGGGLMGVTFLYPNLEVAGIRILGSRIEKGTIEVFFSKNITQLEAEQIATFMGKSWDAFPGKKSLLLKKSGDTYQFGTVIKKEFQNDEASLKSLEFVAAQISRDVFQGAPVELLICDDHFQVLKTLPVNPDMRYGIVKGKVEVYFPAMENKPDALLLAEHYTPFFPLFSGTIKLKLVKRGKVAEVHLMVQKDQINDKTALEDFRQDRETLSNKIFKGGPVEIHLCDELFQVLKVIKD